MTQRFPTLAPPPEALTAALRERFGLPGFRPHQEEAVRGVLAGRDVLLTLPTGGGKSLAYQLPALLLPGTTLVVSPLIALMQDQVASLAARGIAAAFINSTLTAAERSARLEEAAAGHLDLLFVTPERFRSPTFLEALPRLPITRLAVDEAHCISEWGHDFRPDYWRLGDYRALLGDPPTIALTATATPRVADDIVRVLRLMDPLLLRAGIERPGLFLATTPLDRREQLVPAVAERIAAVDGPGIVYSTLIRDLEALHVELRRRGVESLVYHGKLSPEERRSMQARFMESEREVVLATNAFGLGVDKANIRFVLHAQLPATIEAWLQELGRAGRDGEPAWCELFLLEEDLAVQQRFVEWANPSREYLLSVYETLRAWGERVQTKDLDDLRDELLVKQRGDQRVSISLAWLETLGVTAGSFEAGDLCIVRPLDPDELPETVGSDAKRRADLAALLDLWRAAKSRERCRRAVFAEHFGLPAPSGPCGACDVCADADSWRVAHLRPRPGGTARRGHRPSAGDRGDGGSTPRLCRGDWVRVDGRHLGQVVRVEGRPGRERIVVESAGDLRHRTVDPRRRRVERLED